MNTGYLIYPKAKQLFEESGLDDRIKEYYANPDESLYFSNFYLDSDVRAVIEDLNTQGYYEKLPKTKESQEYKNLLNLFFSGDEKMVYNVAGKNRVVDYHSNFEEIILYSGFQASCILNPDEIWDYKKFGFNSLTSFIGTFGAQISMYNRNFQTKGLIWQSQNEDLLIENEITGSEHADLRIYQTDITAHKTIDPFGNDTLFRKLNFNDDIQTINGYHSTEPELLIGVLKYIYQLGLKSEFLENPTKILDLLDDNNLNFEKSNNKSYRDSFNTSSSFMPFKNEIPILTRENEFKKYSHFNITMEMGGFYSMFIDSNEDLVFSRRNKLELEGVADNISCRFKKGDVDNIIKGIFMQSNNCGGRTPPFQLVDIINFYLKKYSN